MRRFRFVLPLGFLGLVTASAATSLSVSIADAGRHREAHQGPCRTRPHPHVTRHVRITLPGIVHQFAPGHRIGLVVTGGSANFRGGLTVVPVIIAVGDPGQTLVLPVVR